MILDIWLESIVTSFISETWIQVRKKCGELTKGSRGSSLLRSSTNPRSESTRDLSSLTFLSNKEPSSTRSSQQHHPSKYTKQILFLSAEKKDFAFENSSYSRRILRQICYNLLKKKFHVQKRERTSFCVNAIGKHRVKQRQK